MFSLYTKVFVWFFGLFVTLVALLNVVVDPFTVFDSPKIPGVNKVKPALHNYMRIGKAYAVSRQHADAFIFGSSRADLGLDPGHPGFDGMKVYNSAVSGSNIYELLRYFEHAVSYNDIKVAVVGLDFFMFNVERKPLSGFSELRLARPKENLPFYLNDYLNAAFSKSAIVASFETLKSQDSEYGYHGLDGAILLNPNKHGARLDAFRKVEESFMGRNGWFPEPSRGFRISNNERSTLDEFRKLVLLAHEEGIELHLLISPIHARLLEALNAVNLWSMFEEWKMMLVRVNEEVARAQDKEAFALWDFSGYSEITSEPPPRQADVSLPGHGYMESSHYKKAIGNLMLNRLFAINVSQVPADFGIKLDGDTIDQHLLSIRESRMGYQKRYPEDVEDIRRIALGTSEWHSR